MPPAEYDNPLAASRIPNLYIRTSILEGTIPGFFMLKVVSKCQVRFKGKAFRELKAASRRRRDEQYIQHQIATQPSSLMWRLETTFIIG